MAKFYFVRHGQTDMSEANTGIYQNWGFNMLTLSPEGVMCIKETAKDERLKGADIIITSPFGRAMHTAAILSGELGIDIAVETGLREWIADRDYRYLPDEEAWGSYKEFNQKAGVKDETCRFNWETSDDISARIIPVLKKYDHYDKVIVVSHGTVIQSFLKREHPNNGEITEYTIKEL